MEHFKYGGSTAERTWHCPAWRSMADELPKGDSSSVYADRGTLLHSAMDVIYTEDDPNHRRVIGMEYEGIVLDEEMYEEAIVPAVAAVEAIFERYGVTEWECESSSMLADDVGGTSDLIGAGDVWTVIIDHKFGHIGVSPVESHQHLFYATGSYHNPDTADLFEGRDKAVFAIVQPTGREGDDNWVGWETTMDRVVNYRDQFLEKVALSEAPEGEPCPGSWCRWCPVAPVCPAKTGVAQRALIMDPKDLGTLTQNLKIVGEMEEWCNAVKTEAHEQLENGAAIKGWKLVMKKANRKWIDPVKAASYLARKLGGKKNVVKESVITPAAAETLAKTQKVKLSLTPMVSAKSSGTTLAVSSDKRAAVLAGPAAAAALASIN